VIGGQVGAAILTADTIRRTNIPAESAFVTAFSIGAVAAFVAVFVALLVTPHLPQSRLVPVAEAVE
jgi:hypothetical protein